MLLQLTRKRSVSLKNAANYLRRRIHNDGEAMTPIQKLVHDSVKASGPMPVSTYMQLCLSHPTEGYYSKARQNDADVFGKKGDFITSPEISQVFGELVCLWLLSIWNRPDVNSCYPKFRVIELGPGRGTLMSDFIRTCSNWPSTRKAVTGIHLIETSPFMRSLQATNIAFPKEHLHWYDSIEDVPVAADNEFTMVVAHEFFDALPINILQRTTNGFRELLIDIADHPIGQSSKRNAGLKFVVSPEQTPRSEFLGRLSDRYPKLPEGTRIEVSATAWRIARKIGEIVGRTKDEQSTIPKGAALVMDYGGEHAFNSSFRAFKKHQITDVFEEPGHCDLTANVDFSLLKEAVRDSAGVYGTLDQNTFLTRMGIRLRLETLLQRATDETRRAEIRNAVGRLLDTTGQGMGRVYRVLGLLGSPDRKEEVWPFISLDKK